jgi:hypothetical protein
MIHILYRHTEHASGFGKNRPDWFSYEQSLNNILKSIEGIDFVKFHLLYDGTFTGNDSRIDYIENFVGGSDWSSYLYALNYAKKLDLKDNDLIYIAENDYAFIQGWPHKIKELYDTYDELHYVTLYDHPDKYNQNVYPGLQAYLVTTKSHHWRITPSTTGSVIFSKEILDEDFDIQSSDPSDFRRFQKLTLEKNRHVLSPIPSLATHCEVEHLAPAIDWKTLYNQ